MRNFPRVPIFVEGDHKFGPWTAADVIAMAKNSSILRDIHKAPVVIGHEENQVQFFGDTGAPSFGFSQDMSIGYQMVKGQPKMALFADLKEVPDKIAALIHQGTYRRISPEIYKRLPSAFDGKVEGPVVKRIAILGGETPEIKDLNDVTNIVREQISADVFNTPRADTVLTFSDSQVDETTGTAIAFCDVSFADFPPAKDEEAASQSGFDAAKSKPASDGGEAKKLENTAKKKPPTAMTPEAKAEAEGVTMTREELVQILAQMGFEVDTITPTIPESFLAHTVMLMRLLIEEAAAKSAEAQIQSVENEANAEQMANGEPTDPDDAGGGMQPGDKPAPVGDSSTDPESSPFESNANAGESDMWQSPTKPKMPAKKDEPATAAFTDQQTAALSAMIGEAINGALVKFSDSTTEKLTPLLEKIKSDREAQDIAFCDLLVKEGKLTPSQVDAGAAALLSRLNNVDVAIKFDDGPNKGKEMTLAELCKTVFSARPATNFDDRIRNKISIATSLDADLEELHRFCDENASALKAGGQTKEQYVTSFKKAKEADPTLTARKYLFDNQAA